MTENKKDEIELLNKQLQEKEAEVNRLKAIKNRIKEKDKKIEELLKENNELESKPIIKDYLDNIDNTIKNKEALGIELENESEVDKKVFHSISKNLEIRIIYGYHCKYDDYVPAVLVRSKTIQKREYTFFLEDINERNKNVVEQIRKKIERFCTISDKIWMQLVNTANNLRDNGVFEQIGHIKDMVTTESEKNSIANYGKLWSYCIRNENKFASLSAKNYEEGIHFGVKLDTERYKRKYGGKILYAISSSALSRCVFLGKNDVYDGRRSNKELHEFKTSIMEYIDWPDNKENAGIRLTPMREGDKGENRVACIRFSMSGRLNSL